LKVMKQLFTTGDLDVNEEFLRVELRKIHLKRELYGFHQ
jgi:hypothetical protein